jgi:hypothetical protein
MIGMYLTDIIDIIHVSRDEYGVSTETIETGVKARIEDTNAVVKGFNGKEVVANAHIIAEPSQVITYEDKIRMVKITDSSFLIDQKKCEIKKLSRSHGFDLSHWEIWV